MSINTLISRYIFWNIHGPLFQTSHTATGYSDMRFISLVLNSSQNVNRPRLTLSAIGRYFSSDWFQVARTGLVVAVVGGVGGLNNAVQFGLVVSGP